MRKLIPILFAVTMAAMLACGDGDSEETVSESQPTPTTASAGGTTQPIPTSTPAQASAEDRTSGGIFRRLWSDPPTLDPHLTSDTTSAFIVVEIHAGLVALSPDLVLVPDIAERWGEERGRARIHLLPETGGQVPRREAHHRPGLQVVDGARRPSGDRLSRGGHVPERHHRGPGGLRRRGDGDDRGQGHRHAHAPDHDRRSQGLLPRKADLSNGLRARPGERGRRGPQLVRPAERRRPVQAEGVPDRGAARPRTQRKLPPRASQDRRAGDEAGRRPGDGDVRERRDRDYRRGTVRSRTGLRSDQPAQQGADSRAAPISTSPT